MCNEFTKGDHFLLEFVVEDINITPLQQAVPTFPPAWHVKERWLSGWNRPGGILRAMDVLLDPIFHDAATLRLQCVSVQRWFSDACTWLVSLIAATVRDAWVHPRTQATVPVDTECVLRPVTDGVSVLEDVTRRVADDILVSNKSHPLLLACLKFLRQQKPCPQLCMSYASY